MLCCGVRTRCDSTRRRRWSGRPEIDTATKDDDAAAVCCRGGARPANGWRALKSAAFRPHTHTHTHDRRCNVLLLYYTGYGVCSRARGAFDNAGDSGPACTRALTDTWVPRSSAPRPVALSSPPSRGAHRSNFIRHRRRSQRARKPCLLTSFFPGPFPADNIYARAAAPLATWPISMWTYTHTHTRFQPLHRPHFAGVPSRRRRFVIVVRIPIHRLSPRHRHSYILY